MAAGRSCLRALLHPAPSIPSRAVAASVATAPFAHTSATLSSVSSALAAAATAWSDSATTARSHIRTAVPGFVWDSLSPAPTTTRSSTSSASVTAADARGSSGGNDATAAGISWTHTVVPGLGWDSRAPPNARAAATRIASAASTAAASVGSWATATAPVRTACPALIRSAACRFGSGAPILDPDTRTPTTGFGFVSATASTRAYRGVYFSVSGRGFSSSAANNEADPTPSSTDDEEPSARSSTEDEEPSARSSTEDEDPSAPSSAYFIVIGQILQTVIFSEPELRYMSDIISNRLQQVKPPESLLAEKVDQIVQVQTIHGDRIDKLWAVMFSKEKEVKPEWFIIKVFGRQLDLAKFGSFILRVISFGWL